MVAVAQQGQTNGQTVISQVGIPQLDAQEPVEQLAPFIDPVADGNQPMVMLGQNVAQPDSNNRSYTDALPMTMWLYLAVYLLWYAHLDHNG
jgi:hypothetical protein